MERPNGYTIADVYTEQARLIDKAMTEHLDDLYDKVIAAQIKYNNALKSYRARQH